MDIAWADILALGASSAMSNPFETRQALIDLFYRAISPQPSSSDAEGNSKPSISQEELDRRWEAARELNEQLKGIRSAQTVENSTVE